MSTGPLGADFCHFRRTEAARESELGLIVHHLIAKDENRVLLKSGTHGGIRGRIGCDLGKSHSASLHSEPWPDRYGVHRPRPLPQPSSKKYPLARKPWTKTGADIRCSHPRLRIVAEIAQVFRGVVR